MDIITVRKAKRRTQIDWIKRQIQKAEGVVEKKKLVIFVMSELGLSKRTASEYIDVAVMEYG